MIMEAEVIKSFIPDLVTAVSGCVQSMSDQCLAKGLITDTTHSQVFESVGTSTDRARTLILAVKRTTETDGSCFELLMEILEQQLPHATRDKILSEMRKELSEKAAIGREVVPSARNVELVPTGDLPRESVILQTSLLEKLEDSIRQHERARTEMNLLEERLKVKVEECEKLKCELKVLKVHTQISDHIKADAAKSDVATGESEIADLRARYEELEKAIKEHSMQVRRGRNTVLMKTKEMLVRVAQQSHATAWERVKEEISMKDREQKLLLHEKDLKIRELEVELKMKQSKEVPHSPALDHSDRLKKHHVQPLYASLRDIAQHRSSIDYWQKLGSHLKFSNEELEDIKRKVHREHDYLLILLIHWLERYPEDERGSTDYPTYTELLTALVECGRGDLASKLIPYNELERERDSSRERSH